MPQTKNTTMSGSRRYLVMASLVQLVLFILFVNHMSFIMDTRTMSIQQDGNSNALVEKVALVHPKPKNYDPPRLVWLLSFPNSGTSYTLQLISRLSNTQVATNYGHENKKDPRRSFPVYADQALEGPFWMNLAVNPNYTFPKEFVIVKTHCGGRCETCGPFRYTETTYSFRRACQRGKRRDVENGVARHTEVHYPATQVAKAIHLIRDPFDNVVSRFRMETRSSRSAIQYNKTREGFRSYCSWLDNRYAREEKKSKIFDEAWLRMTEDVPCRADFFRWIEWHNQAFHLTRDMELETLMLEYGSYSTAMNETCNQLLDFLHLQRHDDPEPFLDGKFYRNYFTPSERARIEMVLKEMSSHTTWRYVSKYFTD